MYGIKELGTFLGRIGGGASVHVVTKSERSDGLVGVFTICGADHRTNNGTAGARIVGPLVPDKVTCKKCLKRAIEVDSFGSKTVTYK